MTELFLGKKVVPCTPENTVILEKWKNKFLFFLALLSTCHGKKIPEPTNKTVWPNGR
jgi:hypothetical protein